MNNFSVLWGYKQFSSKEDARKYCLSEACQENIDYLYGLSYSLSEKGKTELQVCHGHGYPMESVSSMEASYVGNEANRLKELRDYFNNIPARPGYKWIYSDHGLHSVYQVIDLDNATNEHPVFLDYMKSNNVSKNRTTEVFNFWLDAHLNPSINNEFKLTYTFQMENLIPENAKLYDLCTMERKIKKSKRKS